MFFESHIYPRVHLHRGRQLIAHRLELLPPSPAPQLTEPMLPSVAGPSSVKVER